jgi:alcohol dehydrogenase (cytochrome c)
MFAVVCALGLLPAPVSAQGTANWSSVTDARLLKPEADNWLMYRATYNGWGYSPLSQINAGNVKNLKPVWTLGTGVAEGHQAPPMVNNGVMIVATPHNQVLAIDAKSGDLIWRYQHKIPEELFQLHPTSRGVGLYGDKIYLATTDCILIALDAKTGKELWATPVEDWKTGYYMTLSPLIVKGKVMVGVSGGEYGIRGFVAAFDADSGRPAWKTFTIPGPGEPGHDTWPGDTWERGGGSVWITGHYDPELDLTFWGTGNAAHWMGDYRPGDNLWTSSVIALKPDSGKMVAAHQYHHNDSWDWDEVSTPLLMDVKRGGKTVKALVHPARDGYLWVLERTANSINFVDAAPYVEQNVFVNMDPKTGRMDYDPARTPGVGKYADFCPSLWGGKDWPPAAFNPGTGLLYIPVNENLCGSLKGKTNEPYSPGQLYLGTEIADIGLTVKKGADHVGAIQAWDMNTRKMVWKWTNRWHNWGPILTTAGGLVFSGGTNDRMFRALDAKTGKVLWQIRTNSGVTAVPVTYSVGGKQYVAVQSGWGVDAERMQGAINADQKRNDWVPQGGVLWVFALP